MAETHPEPFARRAAKARGAGKQAAKPAHVISVPARAVPIFVFLHVPKTAGTTMRGLFNEMFGGYFHLFTAARDEKRMEDGKRAFQQPGYFDNILMLAGHFHRTHAVVRAITGRRIVFISVMRDPVKRVVSHYDYVRRSPGHRLHGEVKERTLLQAFTGEGGFRSVCENEQTRIMFGPGPASGYDAILAGSNNIIGTLDHLEGIAQAVAALSGMPSVNEMPSFNRIEDLGGTTIVLAKDQPDFAAAQDAIRAANTAEYAFYNRVAKGMIVSLPDWPIPVALAKARKKAG